MPLNLFQVWCTEAFDRISNNLDQLKNPTTLDSFKTMSKISQVSMKPHRIRVIIEILQICPFGSSIHLCTSVNLL